MAKGKETKDRILTAAKRIMADKGYVDAGVDEIMQEANVGKSSFYHFFPSKVALGEAVLDEYVQKFETEVSLQVFCKKIRAKERASALFERLTERMGMTNEDMLLVTWASDAPFLPEELRGKFFGFLRYLRKRIEESLNAAIREFDLFPHAPTHELAQSVLIYLLGSLLLCRLDGSSRCLEERRNSVERIWQQYTLADKPPQRKS